MPFARPTRTELARQALADLAYALGLYALLRTSPLAALAKVIAGLANGIYGYVDWLARQAIPVTATGEFRQMWAALVSITDKPASAASGPLGFTGTVGKVLPEGTRIIRSATGGTYLTAAIATVNTSGVLAVTVEAEDAGAAGNAGAGEEFVISGSVDGINAVGSATGPIAGGADAEREEAARLRMLERYAAPPQGGAKTDYIRWAKEVAGVTRVWISPNGLGPGTVLIHFMMDEANAAFDGFPQGTDGVGAEEPRGTPATGDQLIVADHIYPLRPVTPVVTLAAPIAYPVDYTIADLEEDSSANRAAIATALDGMFLREGAPGGTIYPNMSNAAIDGVAGVTRFTLVSPAAPVAAPAGYLPVRGTITWA